ncbi:AlpA family phage regulatory protein, partial [Pseudomonas sp. GOM6]|uniref:AlpA family phage regulatory protein n=1 Tax=Pseudomonas sp. GOM6 TaxID=3036944 RepID=UPI00240A62D3
MADIDSAFKILRIRQVQERTGLSRSTIYDRLNPSSPRFDADFPRPVKIGAAAIGWIEEGVDKWIRSRVP